jgi:hypothetical protein
MHHAQCKIFTNAPKDRIPLTFIVKIPSENDVDCFIPKRRQLVAANRRYLSVDTVPYPKILKSAYLAIPSGHRTTKTLISLTQKKAVVQHTSKFVLQNHKFPFYSIILRFVSIFKVIVLGHWKFRSPRWQNLFWSKLAQISRNSSSDFRIVGARCVTRRQGDAEQNLLVTAVWKPKFVHPWSGDSLGSNPMGTGGREVEAWFYRPF